MAVSIAFQVAVPSGLDPEGAAAFVRDRMVAFRSIGVLAETDLGVSADAVVEQDTAEFTLADQLDRFEGYWQERSMFVREVHEKLVGLGYQPLLPEIRSSTAKVPASYIRYVDPKDGMTLGSLNSGAFLFVGERAKNRLSSEPAVVQVRDGMRVQLDETTAVQFVLTVAAEFKARGMR